MMVSMVRSAFSRDRSIAEGDQNKPVARAISASLDFPAVAPAGGAPAAVKAALSVCDSTMALELDSPLAERQRFVRLRSLPGSMALNGWSIVSRRSCLSCLRGLPLR